MTNETKKITITVGVAQQLFNTEIDVDHWAIPSGVRQVRMNLKDKLWRITKTSNVSFTHIEISILSDIVSDMIMREMWGRLQKWVERLETDLYSALDDLEN